MNLNLSALDFLVYKNKEWEFQNSIFCFSLPYFYVYPDVQLILILWQKVRQTRIFAIVRVFLYYEEAKKRKKNELFLGNEGNYDHERNLIHEYDLNL